MRVGKKRLRARLGPGVVGFDGDDEVSNLEGYRMDSGDGLRASLLATSGLRMRGCAGGVFGGSDMLAVMESGGWTELNVRQVTLSCFRSIGHFQLKRGAELLDSN